MQKYSLFLSLLLSFGLITACGENEKNNTSTQQVNLDSLLLAHPDSIPLLLQKGNIFADSFYMDKALNLGSRAFRLDSNNIDARFLYAYALTNRAGRTVSDIELAQRHLKLVVAKQPKNLKAIVNLAATYSELGEFERSFQYINEALRIDKKYRDAYILKGSNYLALGNRELAYSSYETAVQQDVKFFAGYLKLGYMYTEDGQDARALEYYKTAAEIEPLSVEAFYGVAYSYQQIGKYEDALKTYRHILEIDNNYYLALYNQGYIKDEYQNEIDSAVYYYRKSVEMEPQFILGWHNLGMVYKKQGRKSDAGRAFATALKIDPQFEMTRIEAGKLR